MKINCLSCGFSIVLDEAYSDYEGPVKCFTCSAIFDVKLEQGCIKSVKFLKSMDNSAARLSDRGIMRYEQ
jgi:DNA-directed RNA polymerase subunit N (RpoN/RPB10)